MTVAIWYRTRAVSRGEGARGTVLPLYLILDENGNVLDLQQKSTIDTDPNEPPIHLIDVATTHPDYWDDEDERDFWERWIQNPELTEKTRDRASAVVQDLLRRWGEASFTSDSLTEGSYVRLNLKSPDESGKKIPVMELFVDRIYKTVFPKGDASPTPP